ncbi:alpha/beta-hydrolase [Aureobasidium sp. EXF-10727]|nr:alpha/beta-hydrolase [Aureobasidium sp. EXF-10727]
MTTRMDPVSVAATADTPAPASHTPKPFSQRIRLWLRLWIFKLTIRSLLGTLRFFRYKGMGSLQPTYRKPLGSAGLIHDIWIPEQAKNSDKLPLYIDIHGGGFAIGDPFHDETWCEYLRQRGVLVVSCDYRKAPGYCFPTQTNDLIDIVRCILADTSLPVNTSKIAMGGFSAGGNLSLSVAQDPSLQGKIKGLLLWYPSTDFSGKYRGEMRDAPDGTPDVLAKSGDLFTYGYLPNGVDLCDPLLSPIYADRKLLPQKLRFVGAEYDVLCNEAEEAAKLYSKHEDAEKQDGDEQEDKRQGVQTWRKGNVWWEVVLGAQHGFNYVQKKEPAAERERKRITELAYERACEWLKTEIYA